MKKYHHSLIHSYNGEWLGIESIGYNALFAVWAILLFYPSKTHSPPSRTSVQLRLGSPVEGSPYALALQAFPNRRKVPASLCHSGNLQPYS